MSKLLFYALTVFAVFPSFVLAAKPVALSESSYKATLGVIIVQVNWGRKWKCGRYENAQLQTLAFTKLPLDGTESVSLELETPSKLFVDNKFLPYVYVVQPGEYGITAFDVKVARSVSDVSHITGSRESLIQEGKAIGGSFAVNPGEIVYVGHFGLDCGAEPFLWRYYIDGRQEFEKYIEEFRQKFPFVRAVPVQFRIFSTQILGTPFSMQDPTVK